eukprot:11183698-Lingulodinium_polyedra.AAC.1
MCRRVADGFAEGSEWVLRGFLTGFSWVQPFLAGIPGFPGIILASRFSRVLVFGEHGRAFGSP